MCLLTALSSSSIAAWTCERRMRAHHPRQGPPLPCPASAPLLCWPSRRCSLAYPGSLQGLPRPRPRSSRRRSHPAARSGARWRGGRHRLRRVRVAVLGLQGSMLYHRHRARRAARELPCAGGGAAAETARHSTATTATTATADSVTAARLPGCPPGCHGLARKQGRRRRCLHREIFSEKSARSVRIQNSCFPDRGIIRCWHRTKIW